MLLFAMTSSRSVCHVVVCVFWLLTLFVVGRMFCAIECDTNGVVVAVQCNENITKYVMEKQNGISFYQWMDLMHQVMI